VYEKINSTWSHYTKTGKPLKIYFFNKHS